MTDGYDNAVGLLMRAIHAFGSIEQSVLSVAIDGRSGAGKSSVAEAVARQTGATLLHVDDFFDGGTAVHYSLSLERLVDICIDRVSLRRVVKSLKSGQNTSFSPFDWKAFDGSRVQEQIGLRASKLLIVEGVYSFHPQVRDLIDIAALVVVADEERIKRLIQREGEISDWERQWLRAEDWYFSQVSPPDAFHQHIENN
ncbi:MAG: hypothetical protein AAGD40_06180 [Pseudomonadota bacterium]